MASHGLRDQDRLDRASNYVIWKIRILVVLEEYDLEAYVKSVVVIPVNNDQKKKYKGKDTTQEMWEALSSLYEGSSEQWKMYLEQKLQRILMQKGEGVNIYLQHLQDARDQLTTMGSTPQLTAIVRIALNGVSDEWQVFIQSILGRERLPSWEEMWVTLQQEELRRDTVKVNLNGSNGSGTKTKEEESTTLASKGQRKQKRKDISKVKCFRCGKMGHYAS
eukprot:PITA_02906